MTRVAILIPCHISYEGQLGLLDKCITSLLEQIKLPKSIYISISFDNDIFKNDFKNILQKYGRITTPKITFKISKEKKHQMEHLHNISSNIDYYNRLMSIFASAHAICTSFLYFFYHELLVHWVGGF